MSNKTRSKQSIRFSQKALFVSDAHTASTREVRLQPILTWPLLCTNKRQKGLKVGSGSISHNLSQKIQESRIKIPKHS